MTEEESYKKKQKTRRIANETFNFLLGGFFLFRGLYFILSESRFVGRGVLLLIFAAILMVLHRPSGWLKE